MKLLRLTTLFLILLSFSSQSQNVRIGDNSTTADPSAILELDGANSQGFYAPQMTESQRVSFGSSLGTSPDNGEGMMVYQTDGESGLYYWEGARWVKYKPFGYSGIVGTGYDTITSSYQFSSVGTGFTAIDVGGSGSNIGEFEVTFDTPFDTYPTIVLTPEPRQTPLPDELPVPDVTCTPSFSANCSGDFNSDQTEAVRVVSEVTIASAGGQQTQVIQNGVGFLPTLNSPTIPAGITNDTSTPEFVSDAFDNNGCSWPQSWMTGTPPFSSGAPPAAANASALLGGCWGFNTDCILQIADPCVVQNGGGNYGRYLPDTDITANTFCNNIYHPAETNGSQQDNQPSLRIGNNAADYFQIFVESSPHWSDAMAAFIDWNRDGDFSDPGEFLSQINPPPCTGGQGNAASGCNGSAQMAWNANTNAGVQGAVDGQFVFPTDPTIAVDFGLTNLRIYSTWTGGSFSNPTLWDEPCRSSTWGETEDFVIEIYDDVAGSAVGLGNDFTYTPAVCGIEMLTSGGNYTGFKVECTNISGTALDTKFHFDVTKFSIY
ncbi:MAG: GEVED domain-containing protein [Bacteroidota bacterium]